MTTVRCAWVATWRAGACLAAGLLARAALSAVVAGAMLLEAWDMMLLILF
ncbi:MAG: hypothetical protein WKF40_09920 [Thermoleophilaceae bacterium]